ncbi:MAG: hypothetical protein M3Q97_03915 [Bacteroidota bacterium]|nr:hypothetical protein [Bacteroidota bacterium]
MIESAIIIFAIAALMGLYLLTYILRNKVTPKAIALIHGPLGLIGLIILIIYAAGNDSDENHIVSIILFTAAAAGGLVLITKDILNMSVPKWLAIMHGLIAVTAFVIILVKECERIF